MEITKTFFLLTFFLHNVCQVYAQDCNANGIEDSVELATEFQGYFIAELDNGVNALLLTTFDESEIDGFELNDGVPNSHRRTDSADFNNDSILDSLFFGLYGYSYELAYEDGKTSKFKVERILDHVQLITDECGQCYKEICANSCSGYLGTYRLKSIPEILDINGDGNLDLQFVVLKTKKSLLLDTTGSNVYSLYSVVALGRGDGSFVIKKYKFFSEELPSDSITFNSYYPEDVDGDGARDFIFTLGKIHI